MQPENIRISGFRKRVEWMVDNLDPDPVFRRFVVDPNDVFSALEDAALTQRTFVLARSEKVPVRRTWQLALQHDSVPEVIIDWVCALYPDMSREHLVVEPLPAFLAKGKVTAEARERWRPAVRLYAEERAHLSCMAKQFYRGSDVGCRVGIADMEFPLLTQPGWIRKSPIELTETSEDPILTEPARARVRTAEIGGADGQLYRLQGCVGLSEPAHDQNRAAA